MAKIYGETGGMPACTLGTVKTSENHRGKCHCGKIPGHFAKAFFTIICQSTPT